MADDDVTGGTIAAITHFGSSVVQPAMAKVPKPDDTVAGPVRAWAPADYPAQAFNPGTEMMQNLLSLIERLIGWDTGRVATGTFLSEYSPVVASRFQELDGATAAGLQKLMAQLQQEIPISAGGGGA